MGTIIRQSVALTKANLKSLPRRIWISLSMVLSVCLVVLVLIGFLAMSNGFRASLENAGSDGIAIALSGGAPSELGSQIEPGQLHLLESLPGIKSDAKGRPVLSQELVVPVDGKSGATGLYKTLSLRGVGENGFAVRPAAVVSEGRTFAPGAAEVVVGRRLSRDYQGLSLGSTVAFGASRWTVVGILDAAGSAQESEMLADIAVVRALFNRPGVTQSVRLQLETPDALATLAEAAQSSSQIALSIKSEKDHFAAMAGNTSNLILFLGWPLALTMAIGAVIGTLTTMYSSVADRSAEIATVRTIGFSRTAAFVSTWLEAMVLTAAGCLGGIAVAWAALDGWQASTTGADQTQIAFQLQLSGPIMLQAAGLALLIGAIGGGLPALRATRVPLRLAMSGRR